MIDARELKFPEAALFKQQLCSSPVEAVPPAFAEAVKPLSERLPEGRQRSAAVAVGSRRIDRIDQVVFQCLRYLESRGFRPFIVPAMGSHGGAVESGQKQVLEGLGISESSMKAPIEAGMETACLGALEDGTPLFFSKTALDADFIVPVNRVKPHTKFSAPIESGICKMLTIGLGKAGGAEAFHRAAVTRSFSIIEKAALALLEKISLLFAVGLVEDGYGRIAGIEALTPENLVSCEKSMLSKARRMMPSIPVDSVDVLVIDMIGKDISGIGMDSNVTGRHRDISGDFYKSPHAGRIFVRDLSEGSFGNANGIGLADFTTSRLVKKIDFRKTYVNALSAVSPEKASVPMYFETDRECLAACALTSGRQEIENLRVLRIASTAQLEYFTASRPFEKEIDLNPNISMVSAWEPIRFDEYGNLKEFYPDARTGSP